MEQIFYHRKIYGKETLFENIFELEAGTYLEYTIKESKIRIFSYWKLENFKMVSAKSDYLEEFEYNFWFWRQLHVSTFDCGAVYCQRITLQEVVREKPHDTPPSGMDLK